jgi:hypothetical protein
MPKAEEVIETNKWMRKIGDFDEHGPLRPQQTAQIPQHGSGIIQVFEDEAQGD